MDFIIFQTMPNDDHITPAGGSTGAFLNLQKRGTRLQKSVTLQRKRILDCGCGPGYYLVDFLNSRLDAYGIEYDANKVAEFQQKYPSFQARISRGDLENIQFPDGSFDLALFNEVLEHVPDDRKALCEAFRVLKPGVLIAIFSPNRFYPFESHTVKLKTSGRILPTYLPGIPYIPYSIGRKVFTYWARNYWPSELRRMVTADGFKIIETDFVWQTFENISGVPPKGFYGVQPILRKISNPLEKTPLLRTFGISQYIIAQKPDGVSNIPQLKS